MRIQTSGKQAYREDIFKRTGDRLDEATKTGAIEAACIHANADVENKREAMEFLAEQLPAAQLAEVAQILSTEQVPVEADLEVGVGGD